MIELTKTQIVETLSIASMAVFIVLFGNVLLGAIFMDFELLFFLMALQGIFFLALFMVCFLHLERITRLKKKADV